VKRGANAFGPALAVAVSVALAGPRAAQAHKPSDAILRLVPDGDGGSGRLEVALRDLEDVLALDADGDGRITWGELRAREPDVVAYAIGRLDLRAAAGACALAAAGPLAVARHSDGAYASVPLALGCPSPPSATLALDYRLLFDVDPQHRGIVRLDDGRGGAAPILVTARAHRRALPWRGGAAGPAHSSFAAFVAEGVRHIWGGLDHLLFLTALLLPSVLRRREGVWVPASAVRPVAADVVRTVSAFTVAHSLTLSLAALHLVQIPARLTESAIAASVVLAAVNNLWPLFGRDRWVVAFALGLLHGFGFASVLADVGLPRGALISSLLGFNLGVELGQLAVVAGCLPFVYLARRTAAYRRFALPGLSAAVALLSVVWLVERAFDVSLITGRFS
jgi:hypothetical protein